MLIGMLVASVALVHAETESPASKILEHAVAKVVFGESVLVASSAIRAVGERRISKAVPRIIQALGDDDTSVRLAALEAVERLGITQATPQLEHLAASGDQRVSERAAGVLREIRK